MTELTQLNATPEHLKNLTKAVQQSWQSLEAEAAVLGSMIVDPECIPNAATLVSDSDFVCGELEMRILFIAICDVYEVYQDKFDLVLLRTHLKAKDQLDAIGGVEFLKKVVGSVPSAANMEYYAGVMQEATKSRSIQIFKSAVDRIQRSDDTAEDKAEQIRILAKDLCIAEEDIEVTALDTTFMAKVVEGIIEPVRGIETGYKALDYVIGGFGPGEIIIVAGRPSMGKTALGMDIVRNVASRGQNCAMFSIEMSKEKLARRLTCAVAGVNAQEIRRNGYTPEILDQLTDAADKISKMDGLNIIDCPKAMPSKIEVIATRMHARRPLDLIVIDYLQLMGGNKSENRQQEVSKMSRDLKAMARALNVPTVILSQLNRASEGREGHKPRMSDIRDSGSIEQDADIILMLHREDYYERDNSEWTKTGKTNIMIVKNRDGECCTVDLLFREKHCTFENMY